MATRSSTSADVEPAFDPTSELRELMLDFFAGRRSGTPDVRPIENARLILAAAQARVSAGDAGQDEILRILGEAVDDALDQLQQVQS
jgi:hypothetical protein